MTQWRQVIVFAAALCCPCLMSTLASAEEVAAAANPARLHRGFLRRISPMDQRT